MKALIVEDDFASRKLIQTILSKFSACDVATNGVEAVEAFQAAWAEGEPYDLICMDIMMPQMDGHQALSKIRGIEKEKQVVSENEVKVIMTTALGDPKNVFQALYREGAVTYLVKPIAKQLLLDEIKKCGLLK
jgi:two-component system, chemotaxis family, chemotaxis protein CheY